MVPTKKDLANALRFLSIDAIEKAKSGHPGMPMGMADIAEVLWRDYLKHNPNNPKWINRDRFVLSNGHGSMLLYSLLHLTGYKISLEDIKNFRQLNSKTPGHPEFDPLTGVETTTGPLGQGLGNAVGMAIAEMLLAKEFNKPRYEIINHYTYCFCGDGCLMEGVSHEVLSLAGTLGLGKLIVLWDDNNISIDGKVGDWFADNTPARFEAYNWDIIKDVDGHDPKAIAYAIKKAKRQKNKPTIICAKTTIGYGAPNLAGTEKCHGSPLGTDEVQAVREALNWNYDDFEVPKEIYNEWDATQKGKKLEEEWNELFEKYQKEYFDDAGELLRRIGKHFPYNLQEVIMKAANKASVEKTGIATRKASQKALNALGEVLPDLLGGSADLTGSNLTVHSKSKTILPKNIDGNYIHYGVREFGMAAIMNGIALYGGFIPYGGTFLVFADYAKNAMRLSALMEQRVIYVLTHDSIGLGEDGPTHQPIEHLTMLRATPNMSVWRPCDEVETYISWYEAVKRVSGPTCLALTRQGVKTQERTALQISKIAKGGYILYSSFENKEENEANTNTEGASKRQGKKISSKKINKNIDVNLIATGSEVEIAMGAALELQKDNLNVQVVSMPSCDVFDKQDEQYKQEVLPLNIPTVAIEAGSKDFWHKYVGRRGKVFGLSEFGKSAPYKELYKDFGLTVENIVEQIRLWIGAGVLETLDL